MFKFTIKKNKKTIHIYTIKTLNLTFHNCHLILPINNSISNSISKDINLKKKN